MKKALQLLMLFNRCSVNQISNHIKYGWTKAVNGSMKSFLQYNDIEMHSMHNEEKFLIIGRFIRTLKIK